MSQAIMTCGATSDEKVGIMTTLFLSESEIVYKHGKDKKILYKNQNMSQ